MYHDDDELHSRLSNGGKTHFDMDAAFFARMRAATEAGLESAPIGVVTTPGTKNATTISVVAARYGACLRCALRPGDRFNDPNKRDLLTLPLSEEISWPNNRPAPFHRFTLCGAQCNFAFGAGGRVDCA